MGVALSTVHWHGMLQTGTSFMDGPPGTNQCPINTVTPAGTLFDTYPTGSVTELNYRFTPEMAGTFWYHGHINEQTNDGLFGPFIIEDTPVITAAYAANGVTYTDETTLMLGDFLQRCS